MAKFHILIVEDDDDIRELLGDCLDELGYRVSTVSRGDTARLILDRMDVDLLLSDELLFGERGRKLAEYARSLGVPTLLMSAHNEIKREFERASVNFIGKPFRLDKLHEQVTRILAEPKAQRG